MNVQPPSDGELIERVARRDRDALETLYDRYAPLALGLATKIVGERAAAEEIVQEVFWQVWRHAATFDSGRGAVLTWIFGITRNLAIDTLRKRERRPPAGVKGDEEALERVAADTNVEAAVGQRLEATAVRSALARLPDGQRRVLEMAYFKGLTHKEIAEALSEPVGTIHSRARMGLSKLREWLSESRARER